MSRRGVSLVSTSVLTRTAGDGSGYLSGPKGDTGDAGSTGPTGPAGNASLLIFSGNFSTGISGSTGASGATAALNTSDNYTSGDIWFPHNVVFYQDAASSSTNTSTIAEIYIGDISLTGPSTLSKLTGSGTYQNVRCTGGPVATGTTDIYAKITGTFSSVKIYVYGDLQA